MKKILSLLLIILILCGCNNLKNDPQISNSPQNTNNFPTDADDWIPTVIVNTVDTDAFYFKQMTYEEVIKKYGNALEEQHFEGALLAKFSKYVLAFNGKDFPIGPSEKVTSVAILHHNEVLDGVSIGKSFQSINNSLGGKLKLEEGKGLCCVFKYYYNSEKMYIWLTFDETSYICKSIQIFFK